MDEPILRAVDDDRALVARMGAGDERAFRAFFDLHFPPLFRFVLTRLDGDADAAEKIVQAALERAVSKLHTWRGEASLRTWLTTFCRREAWADSRRRERRERVVAPIEDAPEVRAALESLGAPTPDPENRLLADELRRRVQLTLDALPGRYGDALEWKYVDGLSVREIAGLLGVTPKAAESLLTRARAGFRDGFRALAEAPRSLREGEA